MNESNYKVLLVILLIVLGAMFGVFSLYAHTIMPGLRHVDDPVFVKSFKAIDTAIINPVFMLQFFLPIGLFAVALFYASKKHTSSMPLLLVGLGCYLLGFLLTIIINVPLNDGIKRVSNTASGNELTLARVAFHESRWVISNFVRTATTLASAICAAIVLATSI